MTTLQPGHHIQVTESQTTKYPIYMLLDALRDALCYLFHQDKPKYAKKDSKVHQHIEAITLQIVKENELVGRVNKNSVG